MKEAIVRLERVKKYFPFKEGFRTRYIKAIDDISFEIYKGETFGVVGESGCGKSTTGRAILNLIDVTGGNVYFEGVDVGKMSSKELLRAKRHMQIIFQDPFASLNPKMRVFQIIEEPLKFHGIRGKNTCEKLVYDIMEVVGLSRDSAQKYPHEFSGGQQQRIGIARALILKPDFIVCDEAVSALDVSVQAQVLNLLSDLKKEFELTYLFISHNLSVVRHLCDRVAVMYLGRVMEIADKHRIFDQPLHPYTKALISAIPLPDPDKKRKDAVLEGDVPSPADPPSGCRFHTRCSLCQERCKEQVPELVEVSEGHFVSCLVVQDSLK